jgi:TorA maturation chaperone TorD
MNKHVYEETNEPARTDMADTAMARSYIYSLLAMIFRAEPTEALLQKWKTPQVSEVFSELGITLGKEFYRKSEKTLVEEFAVEYARLFLGPSEHISPHESVHNQASGGDWGSLWGQETVKIKQFIESAGLEYTPDYTGIPDHISVELEFLQKVSMREATAWTEGDTEGALYGLKMEKMFIQDHMLKWVPLFCDKIIAKANLPFYREMAKITKCFLEFDNEKIDKYLAHAQLEHAR